MWRAGERSWAPPHGDNNNNSSSRSTRLVVVLSFVFPPVGGRGEKGGHGWGYHGEKHRLGEGVCCGGFRTPPPCMCLSKSGRG